MKQSTPVSEIMSTKLVTLCSDDSLSDVEKLLNYHNIRHVPIVEEGKLIGIISRSDILRVCNTDLEEDDETLTSVVYNSFTIPQVMSKTLITVSEDTPIMEVTEILRKQSFHSLPVIKDGKLVGIVTSTDLINYLLNQYYRHHF